MKEEKILKWHALIGEQDFKEKCPSKNCRERNQKPVYRWVIEPIDHEWNFLPNSQYDKVRNRPPRAIHNNNEEIHCRYCAISLFTNEKQAVGVFNSLSPSGREKIGYTHLAIGEIEAEDGLSTQEENNHFGFYEYNTANIRLKFQINRAL